MANMNFGVNLLPNTDLGFSLGSNDKRWNMVGTLNGNAATATKLATARTISLSTDASGSANFDGSANATITVTNTRLSSNSSTASSDPGGLTWFNISGTAGHAVDTNDTPTAGWWYILRNRHTNTGNNYYTDVAIPFNSSSIYYKNVREGSVINNEWTKVLDSRNYTDYTVTKTGTGASGTWPISISGNAATATKLGSATIGGANQNFYLNAGTPTAGNSFVPTTGGTFSGNIIVSHNVGQGRMVVTNPTRDITMWADNTENGTLGIWGHYGSGNISKALVAMNNAGSIYFGNGTVYVSNDNKLYGAVWNDYAEYRNQKENVEPGYVVIEQDDGKLIKSTARLQKGGAIVSDTFGFAIGETDEAKTPIAVTGRVLAYTYEPREIFHAGDAVCTGPDGKVSLMTEEEEKRYPLRCIGIVSEIPDYETWGTGNVKVNNRIWIKVR